MESANLAENMREQLMAILVQKESRYLRLRRQKMNKSMFEHIKGIGVGAFGRVSLVRKVGEIFSCFFLTLLENFEGIECSCIRFLVFRLKDFSRAIPAY